MNKPITRRLANTQTLYPGTYNPKTVKCSECKKRFELLSSDWVYTVSENGKKLWQCSWKCHRLADKRVHPTSFLRGEKVAQQRIESGKENEYS